MSDTPAILTQQVSFTYPDGQAALTDVSFQARAGELVGVVGANGSGKTTLMKVLMRLLKPTSGRVLLGTTDIAKLPPSQLYRRLGMVFQNPSDQLFAPTVEQDVAFGPRNLDLDESEVVRRVANALDAVEAAHLAARPIHHLSFGEQKRACLAGVLAMQPEILILDEPTAGLDPIGEANMIELLVRLNRQRGITMIVSTHSVDLLGVRADRLFVLSGGRMVRQGSPAEIFSDPHSAQSAGLRLPLVAQLFHELAQAGAHAGPLPLTVAQAQAAILKMLNGGEGRTVIEAHGCKQRSHGTQDIKEPPA